MLTISQLNHATWLCKVIRNRKGKTIPDNPDILQINKVQHKPGVPNIQPIKTFYTS